MLCPYCGFQRGEVAEEKLKKSRRRRFRDRIYHLKMASYAALTALLGAFAWYMTDTSGFQHSASMGPYVLFTLGAAAYLVIRVYLYIAMTALKKMRSRTQ